MSRFGTFVFGVVSRVPRSLCLWSGAAHAAQLSLTWSDTSTNEEGFKLERKTGSTGAYGLLTSLPAETAGYVDATVTAGTTYCYRLRAYNSAGDSAYSNEACAAPAGATLHTVAVGKAGTGSGTVTSVPGAIDCGSTCSANFNYGTNPTLTANPATGSSHELNRRIAVVRDLHCPVSAAQTVTPRTLNPGLTVTKSGTGTGTVPRRLRDQLRGRLREPYAGTTVTLTAAAATGLPSLAGAGPAADGTHGQHDCRPDRHGDVHPEHPGHLRLTLSKSGLGAHGHVVACRDHLREHLYGQLHPSP
jgi:hypothetical protein